MFPSELLVLWLGCGGGPATPSAPDAQAERAAPVDPSASTDDGGTRPADGVVPAPVAPLDTVHVVRGTLALAKPAFTPCAGDPVSLDGLHDAAAVVRGALGAELAEAYVELQLDGDPSAGPARIEHVATAIVDGPGCEVGAGSYDVRGSGHEPGWVATVVRGQISVQTMDAPRGVMVEADGPDTTPTGRAWVARLPDDRTVRFEIREERCMDTMASAFYPFAATLTLDGEPRTGCAKPAPPR